MSVEYPKVASDRQLENPDFARAGKVNDWRNHVGEQTISMWPTFTPEQRRAIALDAEERALQERWS